jgi:integrase
LSLLSAARAYRTRDWLMILVAYWHGLRASEVVHIKRVDIQDGYLTVQRGKGSRRTVQPLISHPNALLSERDPLIEYASKQGVIQPIFNVARETFWTIMQRHGKTAGIPAHKRHPHALKHTIGTQLCDAKGVPITQAWLGHVSGNSTLEYTKKDQEQAAAALIEALCV